MSRVEDRLRRDLRQIADRAAPSPTAWDTIRSRIDSQDPTEETEIIMLTEDPPTTRRRWLLPGLAAAAAAIAIIVGVTIFAQDDETAVTTASDATQLSTASDASPADVYDAYIAAFNADDLDAVMALFADDAVVLNDPVTGNMVAQGTDEIRQVQEAEISLGQYYEVLSVESAGNTVTVEVRYHTTAEECYAGTGEITVEQGKIVRWSNLSAGRPCLYVAPDSTPPENG
jgi:ketosteroid isomerase-like protein